MCVQITIWRQVSVFAASLAFLLGINTCWGAISGTTDQQTPGTPSQKGDTQVGSKTTKQLHDEGMMYFRKGENSRFPREFYQKALELWLQEFDLDTNNPNTANNIGLVYSKLHDDQAAIRYHEKAIELDPRFGHAYYSMGRICYSLGDYFRSSESFSKAIELKYNVKSSSYNLGLAYSKLQEYDKAIAMFSKALDLQYIKEDCLFNMGVAYYRLNHYEKSIEVLQGLARDCLYYSKVHFYLGEGFKAQGNLFRARSEFKRAQGAEYNKDMDAAKALKEIDRIAPYLRYLDLVAQIFCVAVLPLGILFGHLRIFRNRSSFHRINKQKAFIFGFLMLFLPTPLYAVKAVVIVPALASVSIGLSNVFIPYGWQKVYGYLVVYLNYLGLVILNYFLACLLYKTIKNERAIWIIIGLLVTASLLPVYWMIYGNGWNYPMDLKFFGEILLRSLSILCGIG